MSQELDAWFAAAGPREEDLRRVDALVMAAAPGIDRQLVGGMGARMLGYGLMPYKPKSAKETTQVPLISLAAQKRHLSMYVFAVVDGRYLAEARAERLGKVSCGKSCIRFRSLDELDVVELDRLVRDAVRATHDGTNGATAS
jgi:hypothetical protein